MTTLVPPADLMKAFNHIVVGKVQSWIAYVPELTLTSLFSHNSGRIVRFDTSTVGLGEIANLSNSVATTVVVVSI